MNIDHLRGLDAVDPLAALKDAFALPDGLIYLAGNSLGALPKATPARIAAAVEEEWGSSLVQAWTRDEPHSSSTAAAIRAGVALGRAPSELPAR